MFQASRAVALLHGPAQTHQGAGRQQRGQRQTAQRLGQVFAVARLAGAATPDGRSDAYAQVLVRRVDGVVASVARARAASAAALAPLVAPGGLEGQGRGRAWPRPQGLDERGDGRGVFGQLKGDWERQGWRLQWQRHVLRRRDAEAQPLLQGGLEAALGAARGQGRVTVGRILSTGQRDRGEAFIKDFCNFPSQIILQCHGGCFTNPPTSNNYFMHITQKGCNISVTIGAMLQTTSLLSHANLVFTRANFSFLTVWIFVLVVYTLHLST